MWTANEKINHRVHVEHVAASAVLHGAGESGVDRSLSGLGQLGVDVKARD